MPRLWWGTPDKSSTPQPRALQEIGNKKQSASQRFACRCDFPTFAKPRRSESLRDLYRKAAKLLHPDLTLDPEERKIRNRLMAEVNDAYRRGDEERIRAILRDWHASPENVQGDGPGAELVRVIRKIAQVEKRLQAIAVEIDRLRQRELFKLKQAVEEAHANGRDLLKELGEQLDEKIAQTREELKRATTKGTP